MLIKLADLEGKTDMKIRALEVVEELRTKRADKQVRQAVLKTFLSFQGNLAIFENGTDMC